MNYNSWDPANGQYSLVMEEKVDDDTGLPGEILTLLPTGSSVDLLSYLPPGAVPLDSASRNLTLLPGQLTTALTYYTFFCNRTGWYWFNLPFLFGNLVGINTGTTYNVTLTVSENTGSGYINIGADTKECGSYSSFTTSLKALVYCTSGLSYDCFIDFAQNGKTYLPVPIPAAGGTITLRVPFVQPVLSRITPLGSSLFVLSGTAPVVVPLAIAAYDFNNYIANDSRLVSDVSGVGDANILDEFNNVLGEDPSGNFYLSIYAPNNFPNPTGGVQLPTLSNIKTVLMWVRLVGYDNSYGQYFCDFRSGLTDGYIITANTGNVGPGQEGNSLWLNDTETILDSTTYMGGLLDGNGWTQVVLTYGTGFTDDMSLFVNGGGTQGMPIDVAFIEVFDVALNRFQIVELFNNRCSRYGLSPI